MPAGVNISNFTLITVELFEYDDISQKFLAFMYYIISA